VDAAATIEREQGCVEILRAGGSSPVDLPAQQGADA
jgi:hypothetical protein